jgi:hypothetical protein
MGDKLLRFKVWEDAAVNSVSSGGVSMPADAIQKQAKKALLKRKNVKLKYRFEREDSGLQFKIGSQGKADEWEKRAKTSRDVRANMWKDIVKKGKARLKGKR